MAHGDYRSKGPCDVFDPWVCGEKGHRLRSENSSGATSGGVWKSGNLEIWEFGDLGIWKSRNLSIVLCSQLCQPRIGIVALVDSDTMNCLGHDVGNQLTNSNLDKPASSRHQHSQK